MLVVGFVILLEIMVRMGIFYGLVGYRGMNLGLSFFLWDFVKKMSFGF